MNENIKKVTKIALSTRCKDFKKFEYKKQKLYELEHLKEIIPLIKDFSAPCRLESIIASFASHTLQEEISAQQAQKPSRFIENNNKIVYLINREEKKILSVKAFPFHRIELCDFIHELSGTDLLTSLHLQHAKAVKILSLGKCANKEKGYLLLGESIAEGENISSIIRTSLQKRHKGRLPSQALKAIEKMGLALAELHTKTFGKRGQIPKYRLDLICKNFAINQKKIAEKIPDLKLNESKISKLCDDYLKKAEKTLFPYGFHHGDVNMENIFYDETLDALTFLDTSKAHMAVNAHGEAQGIPACDFAQWEEQIERLQTEGLEEENIETLKDAFQKSYLSIAKESPPLNLRNLFRLSINIWILGYFCDWEKIKELEKKQQGEKMFYRSINYLKREIEK